jgi:hypothetical protein
MTTPELIAEKSSGTSIIAVEVVGLVVVVWVPNHLVCLVRNRSVAACQDI